MADKLKAAALAAGLTPEEKKKIDQFNKALQVHRELSNLPEDVANKAYERKTDEQKQNLKQNFGEEDPSTKPNRGWFGTAWHYTGGAVGRGLATAGRMTLAGLGNVSDFSTRLYRTAAIAGTQDVDIADAWTIANDKGDKVFNPNRISNAKLKYGKDAVNVAMRIAAGEDPEKILKSVNPEQQKYVMLADPQNKIVPGYANESDTEAARKNFQDTLDAVNASKYSPGRAIANLVTPEQMEGSGLYYKAVSGFFDAAYRILADPLIIAGKAKRMIDASKYALDVVIGANKVEEVFAKPQVINFWDNYGAKIQALNKAEEAKNPQAIAAAKRDLEILAPEFGPAVIKSFQKADGGGVTDALTAKAFFLNAKQTDEIIKGGIGRRRVVMPRMTTGRKMRIAALTARNKVFNIDEVGPQLIDDMFFGGASDTDGIAETIINGKKEIIEKINQSTNFKGISRFSTAYIKYRIDRAKAKLALAPMFQDDVLNVKAANAPEKIYRLAVLIMPRREAKLLSEAFGNIDETGKRKDVYYGLWSTIAEMRGLNTTLPGQALTRYLAGKGQSIHSVSKADDAYFDKGVLPSDFNDFVSVPTLVDLDRAAARNGLSQWLLGVANSDFASKMTTAWSFLTLAGPRYAIRNATEDLMVGLAIGQSPWGLAKSRMLSTRLNTVMAGLMPKTGTKLERAAENPMGALMRMINKKDAERYKLEFDQLGVKIEKAKEEISSLRAQLKTLDKNIDGSRISDIEDRISTLTRETQGGIQQQTREIFARALTEGRINRFRDRLGLKPMNKEEADLLAEQIIYGDIENALSVVSEGGMNFVTGNDYISRAVEFARTTGVRSHALTITPPEQRYVKKPGERQYTVQAIGVNDEASMVAWMMRIGYFANDRLGAIAVANIGNIDDALIVNKMVKWMKETDEGKQFLKDARLSNDLDAGSIAQVAINRTKEVFYKQDGKTLNTDLLSKIRTFNDETGEWVVSGKISLDDLPKVDEDIPQYVVGPTLIPAVELGQVASNLMTNGWTWLGLANARYSRQPLVLQEMIKIRGEMRKSGFEDAWVSSYLKNVDPKNAKSVAAATEKAKRDLAVVVEERAIGQTLAYVDNPLIRTQLAFSTRNFARFYRATEDFYRRMYRVVKYNPEAIVKAALTYEGVTHSGFVQKDDQGEAYFVYPGLAPVYNAVQNTLSRMGIGDEFKVPFPVEFGAKLKMITPSLNPESLVPTFSGPLAGVSVGTLAKIVNVFEPGAGDTIKGFALGRYAEEQPFLSLVLPAHINRLYATMSQDDRNSQYASAWRKAVTYLEASGNGIPKRYDPETNELLPPTSQELEEYRLRVKATVTNILGIRFVFGFLAPASPQVQLKSDMAQWISDNGRANFKQLFNNLLDEYPGDYDKAMEKWVSLYPNQIAFTLTESERKTLAPLRYAEESGNFVRNNEELFSRFPKAAGFLIPHKSGFSWDAYQSMKDIGLIQNKRVDDYLRDVQTAADMREYYDRKDQFESDLENSFSDYGKTQVRKEYEAWKKVFFAGRPLIQEELSEGSQKAIERLNTLDELEDMLDSNIGVRNDVQNVLRKMVQVYRDYQVERGNLEQYGNDTMVRNLKTSVRAELRELSEYNENTKAAYDVLFSRLQSIRE